MICSVGYGQHFQPAYTITLPDSISQVRPARVDLNNDGIFDLLLVSETATGTWLQVVKGDASLDPFLHWQATRTIGPLKAFRVIDYDHDNQLDVVVSTSDRVAVYLNQGEFVFQEHLLNVPVFSELLVADLDDDARNEWVISDREAPAARLTILRQTTAFSWMVVHDSLKVNAWSSVLTDQDNNGRHDVFISGTSTTDSVLSTILVNDGRLGFVPKSKIAFVGNGASADMNSDGIFDIVITGEDDHRIQGSLMLTSEAGAHRVKKLAVALSDATPYLADMDSDGIVDYNYQGKDENGFFNVIEYATKSTFYLLPTEGYMAHVFGDGDRDGDLDLIVVWKDTQIRIQGFTNLAGDNAPPSSPKNPISIPVFKRMLYYWDASNDDHTPQKSITYDLFVDGTRPFSAEFDLLNEKRLSATHGNNGTHHFKLMSNVSSTQFAVQAIDNSLHAGKPCIGSAKLACTSSAATEVLLCKGETTTLKATRDVMWFSFLKGYLGAAVTMPLTSVGDTVFFYDRAAKDCAALKVWTLAVADAGIRNTIAHYGCSGQSLRFDVEPGWASVLWSDAQGVSLGTGNTINYVVSDAGTAADTVTATMTNANGCSRRDRHVIKVSVPPVAVTPAQVRITKGTPVALVASGANRYEWTSSETLSATNVADPIASPLVTTTYQVVGYDSLQCTANAQATVYVENGGFIPNLFTPNGDGKNDEIKIYGITEARDFQISIHNREGSIVYQSSNLSDVSQKGWDGTRQGMQQPAGVYFWKVKGALVSGEKLLLNDKDSGSIVLVR